MQIALLRINFRLMYIDKRKYFIKASPAATPHIRRGKLKSQNLMPKYFN